MYNHSDINALEDEGSSFRHFDLNTGSIFRDVSHSGVKTRLRQTEIGASQRIVGNPTFQGPFFTERLWSSLNLLGPGKSLLTDCNVK